jgi:two-component sensor histidine kinase
MANGTNPYSIDLCFRPSLALVPIVRSFVMSFYHLLLDDETSSRVAVATHELLENSVRYAVSDLSRVQVEVEPGQGTTARLKIRTTNEASAQNVESLRRQFQAIEHEPEPFAYYQDQIRASVMREGSGLGLARIRAECDMTLSLHLSEGDVAIEAQADVVMRDQ